MTEDELMTVASEWTRAAREAWPSITLDEAHFIDEVVARLPGDTVLASARAVHAADLWLAIACADGDPGAIAALDREYLAKLSRVLAPMGLASDQVDEVTQELRKKLLVADPDRPRIADFSGRADLSTWIRTAAVRAGLDLVRRRRDVPHDADDFDALPAMIEDPELAYLKVHYRAELRAALEVTIGELPPRERLLLKYYYVDRVGVERLGALFHVHHATAARWLNATRESLAARAQRYLVERLGVTPAELRSIARLVESQLDVSVRRLLE